MIVTGLTVDDIKDILVCSSFQTVTEAQEELDRPGYLSCFLLSCQIIIIIII